MKKQIHLIYSGRVQGVGFRYTACQLASRHPITGFVRNLENGNVELTAEGEEADLLAFLKAVDESQVGELVRDKKVVWKNFEDLYDRFSVAY